MARALAQLFGRVAERSVSLSGVLHGDYFALDGGRRDNETVSVLKDLTVNIFLPVGIVLAVSSVNSLSSHTA